MYRDILQHCKKLLHYDNPSYWSLLVHIYLNKNSTSISVLPQPPHSSDLAPAEALLKGCRFQLAEEIKML